jgi:hypothetical protein
MDEKVKQSLQNLRRYRDRHYEVGKALFQLPSKNIYTLDFFFVGVLNRSFCLLRGFCDLIETANFVTAAPLIRLQMDNCLRAAAVDWVEDPHVFSSEVLGGKQIRKIKDRAGKFMTDNYLLDRLAKDHPWIRDVYKETSGFIHFSEKHIFNALTIGSQEDRIVFLKISDHDEFVPDSAYEEAIKIFGDLTTFLLEFVLAWGSVKRTLDN